MVRFVTAFLLGLGFWNGAAQNLNEVTNSQFDPDADAEYPICSIAPEQTGEFIPTAGMCNASPGNYTDEDILAVAAEYAPVLYFHPLEQHSLSSVSSTFADPTAGKIYKHDGEEKTLFSDTLTLEKLFEASQDEGGTSYAFEHDLSDDYLAGLGFTDNVANAPIYFNYFASGENTWTFNYWFYYAFNGRVDLAVVSSIEGDPPFQPFQLEPYGQHEGDWESITVVVCESATASQPLSITYNNEFWSYQKDCTAGECNFYMETNHPVGFVALNHHSTYPDPSQNNFIIQFPLDTLPGGVAGDFFVTDNTLFKADDGSYRYFMPTADNVLLIKDPANITSTSDTSELWMAYKGRWGNATVADAEPELPAFCLDDTQLGYLAECEESALYKLAVGLLGTPLLEQATVGLDEATADLLLRRGKGGYGPCTYRWWNQLFQVRTSPLYTQIDATTTEEEFCKVLTEIEVPTTPSPTPARASTPSTSGAFSLHTMLSILSVVVCVAALMM